MSFYQNHTHGSKRKTSLVTFSGKGNKNTNLKTHSFADSCIMVRAALWIECMLSNREIISHKIF